DQGTSDFGDKKYHDKEWLSEKFHSEGLSYSEIAEVCGVSKQTIYNTAKKLGLDAKGERPYQDADWLREEYHYKGKTLGKIADECGVSEATIIKWKKEHNIQTDYPTGEDHPDYIPPEKRVTDSYGHNWWEQRRKALERADHACENPNCDEDRESLGRNPDVHHIIPYKHHDEYDGINDLDNLVVLCRSCHHEVEPKFLREIHGDDESVINFAGSKRAGAV
ncbi:helix-turn-helix domain-containing protein, partial [Halorubrum sp. SP9]|uniref:helix-turn-helix domain-containing protein n=2 Tax=Halorubrum TaxID=56688 RepID=UPI00113BA642